MNDTTKNKTTRELLTDSYSLILQNKPINELVRVAAQRNAKKVPMSKTKMTVTFDKVVATVEKGMSTATAQILDYLNSVFTTRSKQNGQLNFDVKQYMSDFSLTSYPYAQKKLRKNLNNILNTTFSYNDKNIGFVGSNIISDFKMIRGGHVLINLSEPYYKLLKEAYPMPFPDLLFKLNPKKQESSWYILRTLIENKRINYGTPYADKMRVENILSRCPSLPDYQSILTKKGNVSQKIIDPFFSAFEALTPAIDYTFEQNGHKVHYNNLNYQEFINLVLVVKRWKDFPEKYMINYEKSKKAKKNHKKQ